MNIMPMVKPPRRIPKYLLPIVCLLLAVALLVSGCNGNLHREVAIKGVLDTSSSSVSAPDQQEEKK